MTRPSKRALALRAFNDSRKRAKTADPESESEIEEPPVVFPDLPMLDNSDDEGGRPLPDSNAFTVLSNTGRDVDWNDIQIPYQQTHRPSRQTIWRRRKRTDALQAAAAGSRSIRSFFGSSLEAPIVQAGPRIETPSSRSIILRTAITDLEKHLGYNRASRKFTNTLNSQTKERYYAVLHFFYLQLKNPTTKRKDLSLQVAQFFNRGKYFSESLIT